MLDPASAFSVVCAVVQLVQFGGETASKFREILTSVEGSSEKNAAIEARTARLKSLTLDIVQSRNKASTSIASSTTMNKVFEVCKQSEAAANDLSEFLETFKIAPGASNKRRAIVGAVKTSLAKNRIQRLEAKFNSFREQLEFGLLVAIKEELNAAAVQKLEDVAALRADHRSMWMSLNGGVVRLSDLIQAEHEQTREILAVDAELTRDYITAKSHEIRDQIAHTQEFAQAQHAEERTFKALSESLHFQDIDRRHEEVQEAHKETFRWILEESPETSKLRDPFVPWLREAHGIYWIQGKAGSGKSTLMKFVCTAAATYKHLSHWSGSRCKLVTAAYFFWNSGARLQKSLIGMLRTLLYHIFKQYPELPRLVDAQAPAVLSSTLPWTEDRLKTALGAVCNNLEYKVCLFIDGLDEFEASTTAHRDLIHFMKVLSSAPNVKLCVSSRPDPLYQATFSKESMLRLQDLTSEDIKRYVKAQLGASDEISMKCISKAQGVFRWVALVVESLYRGRMHGDSDAQMLKRLEELPDELEEIYTRMIESIEKVYRDDIGVHFNILLATKADHMTVSDLVMASNEDFYNALRTKSTEEFLHDIALQSKKLESNFQDHCRGLVEILLPHLDVTYPSGNVSALPLGDLFYREFPPFASKVSFSHQTIKEYLIENERGRKLIERAAASKPRLDIRLTRLHIIKAVLFQRLEPSLSDTLAAYSDVSPKRRAYEELNLLSNHNALIESERPLNDESLIRTIHEDLVSHPEICRDASILASDFINRDDLIASQPRCYMLGCDTFCDDVFDRAAYWCWTSLLKRRIDCLPASQELEKKALATLWLESTCNCIELKGEKGVSLERIQIQIQWLISLGADPSSLPSYGKAQFALQAFVDSLFISGALKFGSKEVWRDTLLDLLSACADRDVRMANRVLLGQYVIMTLGTPRAILQLRSQTGLSSRAYCIFLEGIIEPLVQTNIKFEFKVTNVLCYSQASGVNITSEQAKQLEAFLNQLVWPSGKGHDEYMTNIYDNGVAADLRSKWEASIEDILRSTLSE